jgi:2,3-bisphosphoglycerate-dependent phosphoglycerate mutase
MRHLFILVLIVVVSSCSKTTYYIVRHAEKAIAAANMSTDVPLTTVGEQRAINLKNLLQNKNIGYIFSTSTIRTTSTANPLSAATGVPVQLYNHRDTLDQFILRLKSIKKKNVLIVGHSNTVDDLVNKLMNQTLLKDLQDSEYDNLFIVKRKGKKYSFEQKKY